MEGSADCTFSSEELGFRGNIESGSSLDSGHFHKANDGGEGGGVRESQFSHLHYQF